MTTQTQQERDKQRKEEIAGEIVKRIIELKNIGVEIVTQLPAPTIMKIGQGIVSLTVDTTTADPLTPKGKLAFEIGGAAIGGAIGGFGAAIATKGNIYYVTAFGEIGGQTGEIIFGSLYDELPESYKARIEDYFNDGGLSELGSDIYEIFEDAAAALAESINEAINEFADTISNVVEETQEYIEQKAKEIYDYVVEKYGELQALTRQAIDALKNAWDGFIENISSFYDLFMEFLEDLFGGEAPQQAKPQTPIVFDMDGDGIELINLSASRVYFDLDNDNPKVATNDNFWLKYSLKFA
jgi:hypothetical protein